MREGPAIQLSEHYSRPPPVWPGPPAEPGRALAGGGDRWDPIRKIWRRKWLVIAIGFGFTVAGYAAAAMMTPRYTAETRVLLGVQSPQVTDFRSVLESIAPNSDTVRSETYVIASREMARRVGYQLALDRSPLFNPDLAPEPGLLDRISIGALARSVKDTLGLGGDANADTQPPDADIAGGSTGQDEHDPFWEGIENRLLARLTVEPLNRSHVVGIRMESTDPAMAARIANTFASLYVEGQLVRKQEATDKANDWLKSRIADLRGKVRESERAVEAYRRENELYATRSDTVIGQQLAGLNQELTRSENAKAEAEARLDQAEGAAGRGGQADSLPAVLQSPLILNLRGKQADLEREAADLAATYTDKHPRIRNIRAQIADNSSKIEGEIGRIVGGLRNELRTATEHHQRVVARMDELQSQMGDSNTQSVELRELEREAEANRTMLESLLERSKETTQQVGMMTPDAEVVSRAGIPGGPSFPPTNLIVLLAAFVGFGAGTLLALLIETLDQTFRTSDEVEEYTGLPTLAVVPAIKTRPRGRFDDVVRNPHSVYANSLRMLSTFLSSGHDTGSVGGLIVFTSAVPGEGKSHTSAGFAQMLASEGRNVVLVDFDWRQPTQHRLFGKRRAAGVIELLTGQLDPESVMHRDAASGVDVLFAGDVRSMQGKPISMDRLQLLLHTLSHHYDVIVLDTSPTMITPEVLWLAQFADHVVMNVKWGSTTRRAVTTEIKNLMRAGARVSGIVLTQVDLGRYSKYSYADGGYFRHGNLRLNPH